MTEQAEPTSKWFVGQDVVIRGYGRTKATPAVVVRVGVALVQAQLGANWFAFRIEDGKRDGMPSLWLQTEEEYDAEQHRMGVISQLRAVGVLLDEARTATVPTETLEQVVRLFETTPAETTTV